MRKNKFSKLEAICFVLICMTTEIILNISQDFVITVGNGSIINLTFIMLLTFIFCFIISKLFKNFSDSDLIDVSEFLGGKILKYIVGIIFTIFFIVLSSLAISNFSYLIKTIYFHKSPVLFLVMFFIAGMLIANLVGFDSIKKAACLIIPFSIISIIFVFINSFKDFTLYRLTPILGQDLKTTFVTGLSNLFVLNIVVYYYFLMPFLRNKQNYFKIIKHSLFYSFIIFLLIIICLLSRFPAFDNTETVNSMYMLTRSIGLTDFIQRVDALFILLWVLSTFSYVSILLFWILEISGKLFAVENKKMLSFPFSFIILGTSVLFFNTRFVEFTKTNIYKYISIFIIFGIGFITLVFANVKKKMKEKK